MDSSCGQLAAWKSGERAAVVAAAAEESSMAMVTMAASAPPELLLLLAIVVLLCVVDYCGVASLISSWLALASHEMAVIYNDGEGN